MANTTVTTFTYDSAHPVANFLETRTRLRTVHENETNKKDLEAMKKIADFICNTSLQNIEESVLSESSIPDKWLSATYIDADNMVEIYGEILGDEECKKVEKCGKCTHVINVSFDGEAHIILTPHERIPGRRNADLHENNDECPHCDDGITLPEPCKYIIDSENKLFELPRDQLEEKLNTLIKFVVARTPLPMAKVKAHPSEDEVKAFGALHDDDFHAINEKLVKSYVYTYLCKEKCIQNTEGYTSLYRSLIARLMEMMFWHIKALRFGIGSENEEKITEVERAFHLQGIENCVFKISHYKMPEKDVVDVLDIIAPYWRLPGVNISGSVIPFVLGYNYIYDPCLSTYAPTYYSSGLNNTKRINLPCANKECEKFVFFPIETDQPGEICPAHIVKMSGERTCMVPTMETLKESDNIFSWMMINGSERKKDPVPFMYIRGNPKYSYSDKPDFYSLIPGADVDVPVFSDYELDDVANIIFECVRGPGVVMVKNERLKGYSWSIKMLGFIPKDLPEKERTSYVEKFMSFYPIEIYSTSEHHIYTHHVAMTRGFVRCVDDKPSFKVCPSFLFSIDNHMSPNYYYFAGKKSTPLNVILKYESRGFSIPSTIAENLPIRRYIDKYEPYEPIGYVPQRIADIFRRHVERDIHDEEYTGLPTSKFWSPPKPVYPCVKPPALKGYDKDGAPVLGFSDDEEEEAYDETVLSLLPEPTDSLNIVTIRAVSGDGDKFYARRPFAAPAVVGGRLVTVRPVARVSKNEEAEEEKEEDKSKIYLKGCYDE